MTHPLTPREKVARCIIGPRDSVPESSKFTLDKLRQVKWEMASDPERSDALWAADAILTALASGSGDHAELARLAEAATPGEWELDGHQCLSAPDGTIVVDYSCCSRGEWEANAAYLRAVQPSRTLALLAENAALRAANDVLEVERIGLRSAIFGSHDYDPTLRHGNFIEMARTTEDARRGAVTRATEAERKLAEAEAEAAAWQDRFRRARIALLKVASVALASARGRD